METPPPPEPPPPPKPDGPLVSAYKEYYAGVPKAAFVGTKYPATWDYFIPADAPPVKAPTPLEPTTKIKPSEALRLGRLKYPIQIRGHWFSGFRACAGGAILAGYGLEPYIGSQLLYKMNSFLSTPINCGGCLYKAELLNIVMHMNDSHMFDDTQIIWVLEGQGL